VLTLFFNIITRETKICFNSMPFCVSRKCNPRGSKAFLLFQVDSDNFDILCEYLSLGQGGVRENVTKCALKQSRVIRAKVDPKPEVRTYTWSKIIKKTMSSVFAFYRKLKKIKKNWPGARGLSN
jgi:hypothetical protein